MASSLCATAMTLKILYLSTQVQLVDVLGPQAPWRLVLHPSQLCTELRREPWGKPQRNSRLVVYLLPVMWPSTTQNKSLLFACNMNNIENLNVEKSYGYF